jgi:hypothetical protein
MRDRRWDESELRRLTADGDDIDPREFAALADLVNRAAGLGTDPAAPAGEEAAVAAFRAGRTTAARRRRFGGRTTALSVALAALLGGGAAVAAAAGGRLPLGLGAEDGGLVPAVSASPHTGGVPEPVAAPGGSAAAGAPDAAGPGAAQTGGPASATPAAPWGGPQGGPGRAAEDGQGATVPAGQLDGLCRSYAHKPAGHRDEALGKPAYAPLVAAAGGPDGVDDYCAARTGGHPLSPPPTGPAANRSDPAAPSGDAG